MVVRRISKTPDHEADPSDVYRPGQEITSFTASLSNYQGYPKAGSMGVTFLIDFSQVPKAWPLTRLTGMELEVTVRRPKGQQEREVGVDEEGNEVVVPDKWDELARKFEEGLNGD